MALESVTYIGDLVATNPTSSDPKQQGDDHIRNVKTAARNCFPGFTGAIIVGGTDTGALNAYVINPATTLKAYTANTMVVAKLSTTNTVVAPSIDVSNLGPRTIKACDGAPLKAGDLVAEQYVAMVDDGTAYRLVGVTKNYVDQLAFNNALPAQSLGFLRSDGTVTGFTTSHTGYAVNESLGAAIASAATVNLTTATGNLVHITGTTTITAITIPVGAERTVIFDGALTLTHGAALLLPGAANITTAAGDRMIVRGDTAGAVVTNYTRANGLSVVSPVYALNLIATITPTVAANVDFLNVFSSSYDSYRILIEGVKPNSASDNLYMRLANAGVVATGNHTIMDVLGSATTGNSPAFQMSSGTVNAASGSCVGFVIDILGVNAASVPKILTAQGTITNFGASSDGVARCGVYNGGVVSGFRLYWNTGQNFSAQGVVRVYGYQKS